MTNALSRTNITTMVAAITLLLAASLSIGSLKAHAAINSFMSVGSTGADVSELQRFLANNTSIYPEGIVSGYYGGLTRAAVMQFQVYNNIEQVGNVGPVTRARINEVMNSGHGLDITAPAINNLTVNAGRTSANIFWSPSEPVHGQVYYDTQSILSNESTAYLQQPYVSGTLMSTNGTVSSVSVTLPDLAANTTYYYIVRSTDESGNLTVTPASAFRTTP